MRIEDAQAIPRALAREYRRMLRTLDAALAAEAVVMGQVVSIIVSDGLEVEVEQELARRRTLIEARQWEEFARDSQWLATKDEITWWLVRRADGSSVLVEAEDNRDYMILDHAIRSWPLTPEDDERLARLVRMSVRLVPPFEPGIFRKLLARLIVKN